MQVQRQPTLLGLHPARQVVHVHDTAQPRQSGCPPATHGAYEDAVQLLRVLRQASGAHIPPAVQPAVNHDSGSTGAPASSVNSEMAEFLSLFVLASVSPPRPPFLQQGWAIAIPVQVWLMTKTQHPLERIGWHIFPAVFVAIVSRFIRAPRLNPFLPRSPQKDLRNSTQIN
ncbi:hypothetical protein ACJZ2D_005467 [Fusarium nematophilum]